MKVLHTADIHLRKFNDERWKTLEEILSIGKKEKIDVFAISGDLFDAKIDVEKLRPKIQEVFSNTGFQIVIIPGNHDCNICADMFFGEDATLLTELDKPFTQNDVQIWGLPFENIKSEEVIQKLQFLKDKLDANKTNILLYHGELLDSFFSRRDFGEEGEQKYMPSKLCYFKDLDIDYVLAGHFHSSFSVRPYDDNKYFVYSGSPISITKKETGRRKVNLFEIGKKPSPYLLETPHFEEITVTLNPFKDDKPLRMVINELSNVHPAAQIELTIRGFIDSSKIGLNEKEFTSAIKNKISTNCKPVFEIQDIKDLLNDDIFKNFSQKLDHKELDEEEKNTIRELVILVLMETRL